MTIILGGGAGGGKICLFCWGLALVAIAIVERWLLQRGLNKSVNVWPAVCWHKIKWK